MLGLQFSQLHHKGISKQKNEMIRTCVSERLFWYLCFGVKRPIGRKEILHPGSRSEGSRKGEVETSPTIKLLILLLSYSRTCLESSIHQTKSPSCQGQPISEVRTDIWGFHCWLEVTAAVLSLHCPVVFSCKNQCQSEQVLLMVLANRRIRKQQLQG